MNEMTLDEATERVRELVADARGSKWDVGQVLDRIHTIVVERGGAVEGGFKGYCRSVLKMNPTTALELVRVSLWFKREDVVKFGWRKLSLIMQATPADRLPLIKKLMAGASKREIEAGVREVNKRAGVSEARLRKLTYRGETKTVAEWARVMECSRGAIVSRLDRGSTEEEALEAMRRRPG